MNPNARRFVAVAVVLLAFAAAGAAQTPLQYRGRFHGLDAQFKVKIESFSTPEEIEGIKRPLATRDFDGFYKALWAMNKGTIQFIGTDRTNIKFNLAVARTTDKGVRILLIADSRVWMNAPVPNEWGLRPFYVVELELDRKFQGDGRMHGAGTIKFTEDGSLDLASFQGEPQMLVVVRPVK